jgi:hypothetical protein
VSAAGTAGHRCCEKVARPISLDRCCVTQPAARGCSLGSAERPGRSNRVWSVSALLCGVFSFVASLLQVSITSLAGDAAKCNEAKKIILAR